MRPNSILLFVLLTASLAAAQETPFVNGEPLFASPAGTGVLPGPASHPTLGEIGPDEIAVDNTGDGLVDAIHDIPAEILQGNGFNLDFRLSPSQQVLFTVKSPAGSAPVCNGDVTNLLVYFHRLETPPASAALASSVCLRAPLSIGPLFYDPGPSATVRTAVVAAAPFAGASGQAVLWVDLVNGGFNLDTDTYSVNVTPTPGGIQFAADGQAAFIDHGIVFRRFTMIDLCRSRVAAVAAGAVSSGDLGSGIAQAWSVDLGGGTVQAEVRLDGVAQPATRITLDDCSTPPPQTWSLDVVVEGDGIGRVVSTPSGIDCAPDCQGVFGDNETVELNAVAEPGSSFERWSGDCSGTTTPVQVTMTSDLSCTANFFIPTADLRVSLSDSPDPATAGEPMSWTVTVTNDGPEAADGVTVDLELTPGFEYLGANPDAACSGFRESVTCDFGEVTAGSSQSLSVSARVGPDLRGDVDATATVVGIQDDPDPANNVAVESTSLAARADLSLTWSVSANPVGVGEVLPMTFEAVNAGPSTATGVVLDDVLPPGVVSLAGGSFDSCAATPIQPGGTARFVLLTRVEDSVAPGTTLQHDPIVTAVEPDPDDSDNAVSAAVQVQAGSPPELDTIRRIVQSGDPKPDGGQFNFFQRAGQAGPVTSFLNEEQTPTLQQDMWMGAQDRLVLFARGFETPAPGAGAPDPANPSATTFNSFSRLTMPLNTRGNDFVADVRNNDAFRYQGCAINRAYPRPSNPSVRPFVLAPRLGGSTILSRGTIYRVTGEQVDVLIDQAVTPVPGSDGPFPEVFVLTYDIDSDGGAVYFTATTGPAPPFSDGAGVYRWTPSGIDALVETGMPIPGTGQSFARFNIDRTLQVEDGSIVFLGSDEQNREGIYLRRAGGALETVADHTTPIPGRPGDTFVYLGTRNSEVPPEVCGPSCAEPSLHQGRIAFTGAASPDPDAMGVYIWEAGQIEPVLEPGDSLDGGTVRTAWTGRDALDGDLLALVAELVDPDGSTRHAVFVAHVPGEIIHADDFE